MLSSESGYVTHFWLKKVQLIHALMLSIFQVAASHLALNIVCQLKVQFVDDLKKLKRHISQPNQ